ncbi:MAG: hypothetical protein HYR96_15575 [Deltaproteobacteria bacterium]|nr:hypothetical protein [Deltaproteobacteria bacterium]
MELHAMMIDEFLDLDGGFQTATGPSDFIENHMAYPLLYDVFKHLKEILSILLLRGGLVDRPRLHEL